LRLECFFFWCSKKRAAFKTFDSKCHTKVEAEERELEIMYTHAARACYDITYDIYMIPYVHDIVYHMLL
jgi:hypothetical protein